MFAVNTWPTSGSTQDNVSRLIGLGLGLCLVIYTNVSRLYCLKVRVSHNADETLSQLLSFADEQQSDSWLKPALRYKQKRILSTLRWGKTWVFVASDRVFPVRRPAAGSHSLNGNQ